MLSVVDYTYDKNGVKEMEGWGFSSNWPVTYVIYNDTYAYVGETLDAIRRTEQHFKEEAFDQFSRICLISDRTFNKSVILDLESFLIKYMSADGARELTNGNLGIVDHDYFYREAYVDDFREVWNRLMKLGIVSRSLIDIENSELFKYSPYKTLNNEQQQAAYEILNHLHRINNPTSESMIVVNGGAGTGKTILAVYVLKLLVDITSGELPWESIEDSGDARLLQKVCGELGSIKKIGFVVPMSQLRVTMKSIFKSVDGLSEDMVLAPENAVDGYYDLLVVDEAHRLYRRHHLPGQHLYAKFDRINESLMGSSFTGTESDLTELDWIIKSSRLQVLFYDENQFIRATDIGKSRFESICKPILSKTIELTSQMRCHGGNGYYDYVCKLLRGTKVGPRDYRKIDHYRLKVFDSASELYTAIDYMGNTYDKDLCKVVTGPGWGSQEDIVIDGETYHWAGSGKPQLGRTIYSIHRTQGFDLNYAGVIFGKEVYYDEERGEIAVNKQELKDSFTKSKGEEEMRNFILNIYVTLMTRGIDGTFVYAVDERLRNYLKQFLG